MSDWRPNSGDTAFVLICTALVLLMTPAISLFYGGMVRRKNVLGTMIQSWILMGAISVLWVVVGYSLAFDKGSPFIGGLAFAGLPWKEFSGQTPLGYADTIPHLAFMLFQMMFAVITPALLMGAVADRMKFKAMLCFGVLWSLFIYTPIAHMVWGHGGLLHGVFDNGLRGARTGFYPALDFAGGTVVHVSSGIGGLVACLVMGKRVNYDREPMPPHSMVLSTLGAAGLWVGWIGFNGGNAFRADELAASAIVSTQLAAATATLTWLLIEWKHRGHPSLLGAITGAVAGLVIVTPAAGFIEPINAIWMGIIGGTTCYFAVSVIKTKLGYDDSLDVFGVHGIGGITGALLTGVFANASVNPNGVNGLFHHNPSQLINQIIAVLVTTSYSSIRRLCTLENRGFYDRTSHFTR